MSALLGELIATGSRSKVYSWGADAVAKVPDPSTPDEWIYAEAVFTEAVGSAGAPAPSFLGIEQVNGRAASIYERIDGPSMWRCVVEQPGRAAHFGRVLADVQGALFALAPPVGLPNQRDRLTSKIRLAAQHHHLKLEDSLALVPIRLGPLRLCHGDLHPANIIMSRNGPIIVDWFDASAGDRLADVARTMLLLSPSDGANPSHLPGASLATLASLFDAYRARIERLFSPDRGLRTSWRRVEEIAQLSERAPTSLTLLQGGKASDVA